jgi:hypothetical protein
MECKYNSICVKLLPLQPQMKDVFYTILVVWIVWRVLNSISAYGSKEGSNANKSSDNKRAEGKTSVDYVPPIKKNINDDEGEYVDYEDVK